MKFHLRTIWTGIGVNCEMAQILLAIAVSWLVAQLILKPLIASFKAGHLVPEAVCWQGGMPSGHAALVGALCSAIAKTQGLSSPLFAVSVVFSVIVLYEALITRNILMRQADALEKATKKKLERVIGHQPLEVMGGVVVGVVAAWYLV